MIGPFEMEMKIRRFAMHHRALRQNIIVSPV
jgi:hypothetical protein